MINFQNSIISLKATWVRRLITNQSYSKPLWIELFEKMYNTNITKFTNFGTFYPVILKKRSNKLFWNKHSDACIYLPPYKLDVLKIVKYKFFCETEAHVEVTRKRFSVAKSSYYSLSY